MTVTVSFCKASGSVSGPGIGVENVRVKEVVTVPGTTTITAESGEFAIIGNGETVMVAIAVGTTPDAAAVLQTTLTTAGYPVGAGCVSDPFLMRAGAKVNIKVA